MSDAGPRHLVLVGLMGAGKSSVGARCAERLGRPFVDTDTVVESLAGGSIADLFAEEGEAEFRKLERTAVADACVAPVPTVIAAGGGAVLDPENRRHMRDAGFVVWLRAPAARLAARVGDGRGRPLLSGDPAGTLERLETVRRGAYEAVAHSTVDTEGLSIAAVVDEVLSRLAATGERVP